MPLRLDRTTLYVAFEEEGFANAPARLAHLGLRIFPVLTLPEILEAMLAEPRFANR